MTLIRTTYLFDRSIPTTASYALPRRASTPKLDGGRFQASQRRDGVEPLMHRVLKVGFTSECEWKHSEQAVVHRTRSLSLTEEVMLPLTVSEDTRRLFLVRRDGCKDCRVRRASCRRPHASTAATCSCSNKQMDCLLVGRPWIGSSLVAPDASTSDCCFQFVVMTAGSRLVPDHRSGNRTQDSSITASWFSRVGTARGPPVPTAWSSTRSRDSAVRSLLREKAASA